MNEEIAEWLVNWEDFEDYENYVSVTGEEIVNKGRWTIEYKQVYKNVREETFWEVSWYRGATEYQEGTDLDVQVRQVFPIQTVVTIYK